MKRSLMFWGKQGILLFGTGIGIALIICSFLGLRMGSMEQTTTGLFFFLPFYIAFTNSFMLISGLGGIRRNYIPVVIAMNGGRKRTFWGINFMALLVIGLSSFPLLFVKLWLGTNENDLFFVWIGGMFLAGSLGILVEIIAIRWGNWGVVLVSIATGAFGAVVGLITAGLKVTKMIQWMDMVVTMKTGWFLTVSIVIFLIFAFLNVFLNRNYEVAL